MLLYKYAFSHINNAFIYLTILSFNISFYSIVKLKYGRTRFGILENLMIPFGNM